MSEMPNQLLKAFDLQNDAVVQHIQEHRGLFDALSQFVDLIGGPGIDMGSWHEAPEIPKTIFNYFYSDSFSSLVSAARLAFHGVDTDSYALVRVVVENLTILEYVTQDQLYDAIYLELQERVKKGRPFGDRFSFETASRILGVAKDRRKLWGDLSNLGSHSSPLRLRRSRLEFGNMAYYKVGVGIGNPGVAESIEVTTKLAAIFGKVMGAFYLQFGLDGAESYSDRLSALTGQYFRTDE